MDTHTYIGCIYLFSYIHRYHVYKLLSEHPVTPPVRLGVTVTQHFWVALEVYVSASAFPAASDQGDPPPRYYVWGLFPVPSTALYPFAVVKRGV